MTDRLAIAVAEAERLGADHVEVSWAGTALGFARFASSHFHQVGESVEDVVRVRVLSGGRLGAATAASLDEQDLRATAAKAILTARRAPRLGVDVGFASAAPSEAKSQSRSESGSGSEPEDELWLAPLTRAFERAAGMRFYGSLKKERRAMAVATSGGIRRFHRDTALHLQVIAQTGDGSGWADWYGREPVRLDPAGVVDRAADIARRARNPVAAPSGPLDVVLAPAAVAALVEWMALGSFGARGVLDGTSLLAGREGELLCSPRITLREGVGPGEPPFDSEGVTRRPVDFLRAGCGGRPVSDLLTAARLGHAEGSTGHAQPLSLHASAADPTPGHAILEPGGFGERDLIAMVDHGLYVTRFHYVNGLLDTRRATMTGMTRDGTFLIEKGTLTRPVVNLRFTDSILDALSEPRLGGIGKDLVLSPTWYTAGGEISTPALLLRRLQFGPPAVSR